MSPLPTLEALSGSRILMSLSLKVALATTPKPLQGVGEHVERQRSGELQALQGAALAVWRRGELADRIDPDVRQIGREVGRVLGQIVERIGLRIDVRLQILVEVGSRHVRPGAEVLFVGNVERVGTPRIERGVAAAGEAVA